MQDEIKRLVLADDHHLLRRGFRSLLSDEPGLEVVGEESTGLEARPDQGEVWDAVHGPTGLPVAI